MIKYTKSFYTASNSVQIIGVSHDGFKVIKRKFYNLQFCLIHPLIQKTLTNCVINIHLFLKNVRIDG